MVNLFYPGSIEEQLQKTQLDEDNKIRGKFIVLATHIEFLVGWILCEHFCPDEEENKGLMYSLLICWPDSFGFSSRIQIFDKLLELRYPDLMTKYPKIIDRLNKIRTFRNRLAHAAPDIDVSLKDKIRLKFYDIDGTQKQQDVTFSEVTQRETECLEVFQQLEEIRLEIIKNRVS